MRRDWERDFVEYVSARSLSLRRTAYLLCGDWHQAEDLTQVAFTKLYAAWRRLDRSTSIDGYVRQTLVRAFVDGRRRFWNRERPRAELPEQAAPADPAEDRLALLGSLATLPATQRAVLVLRYWEDLSVAETAAALDISEGTVKSAASRGLTALRGVLQLDGSSLSGREW
jgi:RNA polymerase sigma-70 factor (sigma-E family)